jgi:hypothetical protein
MRETINILINGKVNMKNIVAAFLIVSGLTVFSFGQATMPPRPMVTLPSDKQPLNVAERTNLFCAGYIETRPVYTDFEIIAAENERERNVFTQGDEVYISRGQGNNLQVGDVFSIIRPLGSFKSNFSKKGKLGFYIQEVGAVEVTKVEANMSVARIKTACNTILLGDLLLRTPNRNSPVFRERPPIDKFGEPSGKATGRIVLARDGREALSSEQIVYIDLGAEDNVEVGNYLTIFRPLGKGGVLNYNQKESLNARDVGFQSDTYRGGKFSNQAPRKEGASAEGNLRTSTEVKRERPKGLRKVMGEMVILNVKERTATALITRNTAEIHTGDMVELQ